MKTPIYECDLSPDERKFLDLTRRIPRATLNEVWRVVDLIKRGKAVSGDPNIIKFAEMIAEAQQNMDAKASHPFDPDKTNGAAP